MNSLSPASGPAAGGTTVTITGNSFTGATRVTFGATEAASFSVNSATSITATAPAGTGTVDVTVTNTVGTSTTSSSDQFSYAASPSISSLSVTGGSIAGGTTVIITGTNFAGATAVRFGAVNATSFTVNGSTQITAVTPAGSGTADVTVTTAGGTSPTSAADQYTYIPAPVAGAVTTSLAYNSSNNLVALNLSGGSATVVAVATQASHGTATASGTTITYTPAAGYSGLDSFTYTAANVSGTSAAATVTVTVTSPPLTTAQAVASTTLTQGVAATVFTPVTATGGAGTLTYTFSGGTLPAGLVFSTTNGQISGTPTAILAATTFTVTVTDQTSPNAQSSAKTFSLTVNALPIVVTNPANVTVTAGATATFTTTASGTPTPTVQWQSSTDGVIFANIAGATSLSYSFATNSASQSGMKFRAVLTNSAGSATTLAATLTVNPLISVSTNPVDVSVFEGQNASFTVAATGTPAPTVQWQKKTATGTTFTDISGANSLTLSFEAILADNGSQYRAVFTNTTGTVTTTAARLTVTARPDPTKDAEVTGVINAETQTAFRFADQQLTNFDERLTQLHGSGYASSGNDLHLGFGFGSDQTDATLRRRADRRSQGESLALNGIPSDDNLAWEAPHQSGPNIEGQAISPPTTSPSVAPNQKVGVWLGGAITFGQRDPSTRRASFKFQSSGLSAGADLRFSDKLSIGVGIGVNDDTTKVGSLGTRVKSHSTVGVVYGGIRPGGTAFIDVILAQGSLSFDSHRAITSVVGQSADGSRKGTEGFASLKVGWDWSKGRDMISPYVRLTIVKGQLNPFTETTGGSFALSYQKQSLESQTLAFGGRAGRAFPTSYGVWIPNVMFEYAHDFKDNGATRISYADWLSGPVFLVPTDPYFHDRIVTGLGTKLDAGGINFSLDYRHNFDSNATSSDSLMTQLRLKF